MSGVMLLSQQIKDMIPDDNQKIVLQTRLQFKINEKFEDLMEIDPDTGKGNLAYNLFKNEIDPFMKNLNQLLFLSEGQEESLKFLFEKEAHVNGKLLVTSDYFKYYQENRSKMKRIAKERKLANENNNEIKNDHGNKSSLLITLVNTISNWLLLPFVFIFLLFDSGQIMKFGMALVPNKFFEMSLTIFYEVDKAIGNYLRGTVLECSLVGLTLSIGLFLIGFDPKVALAIGIVAGITNAIPFLGPAIGLGVGLTYGLIVEDISPILPFINLDNLFIAIFFCVLTAQLLDNAVFQPIVLGSAVNLHPLVVIIGVMGGSVIFGFAGMLLAIPAIVIFKVIIETLFRELKAYKII